MIADGFWFAFHQREYLINSNDLFVELYETFNWSRVNEALLGFDNWTLFEEDLIEDPLTWLSWSWDTRARKFNPKPKAFN